MENNELLSKISDKLEEINKEITQIKITLAEQHKSLEHHIYRTSLLENNLSLIKAQVDDSIRALQEQIKPVQDHVKTLSAVLKFLGFVGLCSTVMLSILQIISFFK